MKDMAQWETLFLNYFQDNISDIQKKKKKLHEGHLKYPCF